MGAVARIRLAVCLAGAFVLASDGSALAKPAQKASGVSRSDISATRAYLRDRRELSQTEASKAAVARMSVHELIAHVHGQCPNALAGAPSSKAIESLRLQTLSQISHALGEPTRAAQISFEKKVHRLRWSNHKLTYYARGSAEESRANAELVVPDICSEASAIASSGYQIVPASMAQYEREENTANSKVTIVADRTENTRDDLEEIILRMLKPYERPDDGSLIPRTPSTKQLEAGIEGFFASATELIEALGLPKVEEKAPTTG